MKTTNTTRPYRCELDVTENVLYLTIEATITPADERRLTADGWRLLNNGVTFDSEPRTAAFYFAKNLNR